MVEAIFSFLCSILISLGGSVTADNIGQDFATIYSNQDPSVQRKMDTYFYGNPGVQLEQDIFFHGTKLTTEILYNIQYGNVSNQVIQESVGIDGWKNFIENNQSNVLGGGSSPSCRQFTLDNGRNIEIYLHQWNDGSPVHGRYTFKIKVIDKDGNIILDGLPWQVHYAWNYLELADAQHALSLFTLTDSGILTTYKCDGTVMEVLDISPYFGEDYNGGFLPVGDGSIGSIADAAIGGATIGQVPIASDGSVTLPDGTKVYPNSDGTYTIENNTYSPVYNLSSYNDTALLSLLSQILQRLNDLEGKLEFEQEGDLTTEEDLKNTIDEAVAGAKAYTGSLSEFMLDSTISTVFPFCLPFDFVRGVKLFSASPVTPSFSFKIDIPSVGSFNGTEIVIKIDFSKFESVAYFTRWTSTIGFSLSLIFISTKIVKGAGS